MNRTRRRARTWVAPAVIAALVGSACGGTGGEPATPSDDEPDRPSGVYAADIPEAHFERMSYIADAEYGGVWTLRFEDDGGYGIFSKEIGPVAYGEWSAGDDTITFDEVPAPKGTFNCFIDGERTLTDGRGVYEYDLEGNDLTFRPRREPCRLRKIILRRSWSPRS